LTALVVDASAFAAVLLPDEWTVTVDAMIARIETSDIVLPGHWMIELASILLKVERRGRVDGERTQVMLDAAARLEARATAIHALDVDAVVDLARRERLTPYDAAYLAAALDHDAELASNDHALLAAAGRRGVICHSTLP